MNKTTTALTDAMTYAAIKYTRRFQERGYTEVEMAEDIGKACAEAALKELDNEWVRVSELQDVLKKVNKLRGMQPWITDREMKVLFSEVMNSIPYDLPSPPKDK